MILLIDNYDSFSYNLYQLAGAISQNIKVVRNDAIDLDNIEAYNPSHILISPGPGRPSEAGRCEDIIRKFTRRIPILGVCLGHQAICEAFGASIGYAKQLMHGKTSQVQLETSCPIFKSLPPNIIVGRYHSLVALEHSLPQSLTVTARSRDGEIMAVRYNDTETYGVQFHPESILTPCGRTILENFLSR
ncbi:MAG: aminodeoxychorismate/anthranilate synthase component II [Christensenellaceae bacterium]|jgi:anthranilate synthase component 2|nr:aminodeoxychorismate/anthranilate synthase component II [Christensenellaceae bacterium]